jgi:hypothetical protein
MKLLLKSALILSVIAAPVLADPRVFIQSWSGKINPALSAITIKITKDQYPIGGDIQILSNKGKLLWIQKKMNPWKLCIVDIDGDGSKEILVGVYKKSLHDPIMANRLFIYKWNGKRLLPFWLSSRLTRRFTDFTAADIDKDGKAEVFALEVGSNNTYRVSMYKIAPFGMEWVAATEEIDGPEKLTATSKPGVTVTATGSGRKWSLKTIVQGDTITGLTLEEIK